MYLPTRVLETTTSVGTGDLILLGASPGYRTIESEIALTSGSERQLFLIEDDSNNWEIGYYAYDTTSNTVLRNAQSCLRSSAANSKVSFAAGTKVVGIPVTGWSTIAHSPLTFSGASYPRAIGPSAMAAGANAVANDYGLAYGEGSTAAVRSVVFGTAGNASGLSTAGIGDGVSVSADGGVGMGKGVTVSHKGAISMGIYTASRWPGFVHSGLLDETTVNDYTGVASGLLLRKTTDATPVFMRFASDRLNGTFTGISLTVGYLYTIYARVTAHNTADSTKVRVIDLSFTIKAEALVPALVLIDAVQQTVITNVAGFTPTVSVSLVNDFLKLTVTGIAATTINWSAYCRIHYVSLTDVLG